MVICSLANSLDLVREDYRFCPECGRETEVNATPLFGTWYAEVNCPDCGFLSEVELDPPNEAEVRY